MVFSVSWSWLKTSAAVLPMSTKFVPVATDSFAICSRISLALPRSPVLRTRLIEPGEDVISGASSSNRGRLRELLNLLLVGEVALLGGASER